MLSIEDTTDLPVKYSSITTDLTTIVVFKNKISRFQNKITYSEILLP
jgi:hypothetical protein